MPSDQFVRVPSDLNKKTKNKKTPKKEEKKKKERKWKKETPPYLQPVCARAIGLG